MKWLNLEIATLRSPEFIGSSPTERATWLCVMAYCIEQENGGHIVGAERWKDRQWQQACGVTLKEVKETDRLLAFDGDDLLVSFYPLEKQSEVQGLRALGRAPSAKKAEAARLNGSLGGRPKITQEITHGNPPNNPPVTQGEPTVTQEDPIEGKGIGKERKGREGEGARAHAEQDICTPVALENRPATDADHWQMAERNTDWARALKAAGCKIGRDNWTQWRAIVEAHSLTQTLSSAKGTQATERWPDRVESTLTASRGQANPGEAAKAKTIKVTL